MPSQQERGETGGGDRHKEASRQAANKRQKTDKDRARKREGELETENQGEGERQRERRTEIMK